jgi:hypothetical protein
LLSAVSDIYDSEAQSRSEKSIVRKLSPDIDKTEWNSPGEISQTMNAASGGNLEVHPSVINRAWRVALQASILRQTTFYLQSGNKVALKNPDSLITRITNDPRYKGQFAGYSSLSRYALFIVDSYVDGKMSVVVGLDPKSNQLAVSVLEKKPVLVDRTDAHSITSYSSQVLLSLKISSIKQDNEHWLTIAEDRRDRDWSKTLARSSPFEHFAAFFVSKL